MFTRFNRSLTAWLAIALLLLLAFPLASAALAQTDNNNSAQTADSMLPGEVEIVGVLESFDGTTLVIGGVAFDASAAEIKDALAVGEVVKIHASFTGGLWVVREAEINDDANDNADDNGNFNDNADDNGNFNDNADDNSNDNFDDNSNDNIVDNSNDNVNDDAPEGEFEITGVIEQVGDGFIVVAGQTIDVSSAEIKDALVVGMLVKVHVSQVNGQLVAREAEDASRLDDGNRGSGGDDDCGSAPESWTTYTVQSGDTLSGIASRTDSDDDDLAEANCIEDHGLIVIGSEIRVPRTPDPRPVSDDNGNDNFDDDNDNFDDHDDDNDNFDDSNDNFEDNDNHDDDDDNSDDHGDDDNGDDHGGDDGEDDDGNSGHGGGDDSDDD